MLGLRKFAFVLALCALAVALPAVAGVPKVVFSDEFGYPT
jgi:hypothetical protein